MTAQLVIPIKLINFKFLRLNTLFKIYIFYYVNDSLACMYVYVITCVPDALRGQKRALGLLVLESQRVVSGHKSAGN